MASEWYYSKDGARLGPVPSQRLKELAASGELGPNDLVWKEGLTEWKPASTLKGLFPASQPKPAGPPPLPSQSATVPPQLPPESLPVRGSASQEAQGRRPPINPFAAGMMGLAQKAVDYAKSDEAKELARKTQERIQGGAKALKEKAAKAAEAGRAASLSSGPPTSWAMKPGDDPTVSPTGPAPMSWGAKAGGIGCLGVLGLLFVVGSVASLSGVGKPTTTIAGGTATVKVEFEVNGSRLLLVATDAATAVYSAAKSDPAVKKVVVILWMKGSVVDGYGKPGYVDEELGRIERDAEEVRRYHDENGFMNRQLPFYEAEVLSLARANGRGLFSDWK